MWLSSVDDGEHVEEGFHGGFVVFADHDFSALWAGHAEAGVYLSGVDGVGLVSAVVACGGDAGDVEFPCGLLGAALGAGGGLSGSGVGLELVHLLVGGWLVFVFAAFGAGDGDADVGFDAHDGSPFRVLLSCVVGVAVMIPLVWLWAFACIRVHAMVMPVVPVLHGYAWPGVVVLLSVVFSSVHCALAAGLLFRSAGAAGSCCFPCGYRC